MARQPQAQQKTAQTDTAIAAPAGNAGALALPAPQRNFLAQIKGALSQQMPILSHLLPNTTDQHKFVSNVLTAIVNSKDGKLFECDPHSILKASREAVEFGLSLNPHAKQADLIPRWNNRAKKLEAQFQIRYGGLMTLAKRSGEVISISSTAVREGDHFVYKRGLDPVLEHTPKLNNKGDIIAAYCVWILKDGTKEFEVIEQEDILRAQKASQSRDRDTGKITGPWETDYEEQVRKTAVRRASKYMPSSAEDFQKAVQMDTMRDIGHDVALDGGEIVDITEPAPTNPQASASKQMDNLEGKITGKASPSQAKVVDGEVIPPKSSASAVSAVAIETIPIQKNGEDMDVAGWVKKCAPVVRSLPDQAARDAWQARHATFIEGADFTAPDQMDDLYKALRGE